ncbi:MAG: hypothetical protein R2744_07615 [Bacteroidales bacterium]
MSTRYARFVGYEYAVVVGLTLPAGLFTCLDTPGEIDLVTSGEKQKGPSSPIDCMSFENGSTLSNFAESSLWDVYVE